MRNPVRLNGKLVRVSLYEVRGGGWTSHFDIERHNSDHVAVTHHESGAVFPGREAAEEAAIQIATKNVTSAR